MCFTDIQYRETSKEKDMKWERRAGDKSESEK
jgi:hypothetical protein